MTNQSSFVINQSQALFKNKKYMLVLLYDHIVMTRFAHF